MVSAPHLNPLVVLVVTIGAGCLFGMLGLVLAAPLVSALEAAGVSVDVVCPAALLALISFFDDRLDLSAWARDSLILALPDKILCRPDCAGLCPVCGKDLNAEPHEHVEERTDPRWAKLSQLRQE